MSKLQSISLTATAFAAAVLASCGSSPSAPNLALCDTSGMACDWAGHDQLAAFNGDGKPLRDSNLYSPLDIAFAPDNAAWVIDWNNHRIRRVQDGKFKTVIGNFVGDGDAALADLTPDGAPALSCNLNHPTDLQFLPDGSLIFAAWHNHKIRHLDWQSEREWVMAGRAYGFAGDGGPFADSILNQPKAIVLAPDGSLFILDQRNERIRKVDAKTQQIATVVGTGVKGFSGDGGDPAQAQLNFEYGDAPQPSGSIKLDSQGRLYIADSLNNRVRRVDFTANTIETIIGTGEAGFSGDNGPGLSAQLNNPRDLEFGPDGRLYIADTENYRIRAFDLTTGIITTVAGTGKLGAGAELQPATQMDLNRPFGIGLDKQGNLYIADTMNNRVVRVAR